MMENKYFITMPRRCGKRFQMFKEIVDAVAAGKKVKILMANGDHKVYESTEDVKRLMVEWFGKDGAE